MKPHLAWVWTQIVNEISLSPWVLTLVDENQIQAVRERPLKERVVIAGAHTNVKGHKLAFCW